MSTPETKTLRPVRTQSPPSRRAVVVMRWEFDPASGSVMPKAMVRLPSARPGSHVRFCSSVPKRAMTVPQIAGDTIITESTSRAQLLQHDREFGQAAASRRRTPRGG
ncbi:hypothetical protein SBADM41S_05063 [Streptomyces badius]